MVTGWVELIKRPFNRSHDFVSVDARRISDPRNYEMLTSPPRPVHFHKSVEDIESSPDVEQHSPRDWEPALQRERYFGRDAAYRSPTLSFSSPRPPSRSASGATRSGSSHGKHQGTVTWANEKMGSPPILERTESPSSDYQSDSAPGREHATAALGRKTSGSALGTTRSSSALGRERNDRSSYQRSAASPTPGRSAALGRDWDPRSTFAKGGGTLGTDRF